MRRPQERQFSCTRDSGAGGNARGKQGMPSHEKENIAKAKQHIAPLSLRIALIPKNLTHRANADLKPPNHSGFYVPNRRHRLTNTKPQ